MPQHTISFSFTVEGTVTDVLAYANGIQIQKWQANGKFAGGFSNALIEEGTPVVVDFYIIGLNGTEYQITTQFRDNGVPEQGSQPSPISDTIASNMQAHEQVIYTA